MNIQITNLLSRLSRNPKSHKRLDLNFTYSSFQHLFLSETTVSRRMQASSKRVQMQAESSEEQYARQLWQCTLFIGY